MTPPVTDMFYEGAVSEGGRSGRIPNVMGLDILGGTITAKIHNKVIRSSCSRTESSLGNVSSYICL